MPTAPPTVPTLPAFPAVSNRTTYNQEAFDCLNTLAADVAPAISTAAAATHANAAEAAAAAITATSSAATAAAAANFKGEWTSLTGALAVPACVKHSGRLWLLLSGVGDVTAYTPGVSAAWTELVVSIGPRRVSVTSGTFTAVAGTTYVFTSEAALYLPASPIAGDWVAAINRSGGVGSVIYRNGQNIMGLAENMTLDNINASVTLVFADATRGWVLT